MAASVNKATVPILIYSPGLGQYAANTADGVADVLARIIDRQRTGTFTSAADSQVTAPRGLKAGKSILDADGVAVLQLFELDYGSRLGQRSSAAGPPVTPGVFKSSLYALLGCARLIPAFFRGAKSKMACLQLALASLAAFCLVLAAVVTIVTAFGAAGVGLPNVIEDVFGARAAQWTIGLGTLVTVGTWSAVRSQLLGIAATTQQTIRYVVNEDRNGDTVALTLDDAVDGLRDNGWTGKLHLLGYSFGSLVLFDAMFPMDSASRAAQPVDGVASLTTIGCPIDAVRLFWPSYTSADRTPRCVGLPWSNVFIATDVFGSNLADGQDQNEGPVADALGITGANATSIRYLEEELGLISVLKIRGFTTHSGYWGTATDASCLDKFVAQWCP